MFQEKKKKNPCRSSLPSVPHTRDLSVSHLPLQLEDAVHEGLARRWTPGDVNVHGNNAVTAPDDAVTVVVVAAAIGTASHGDDPSGLGHLIIDLTQRGSHLVGKGSGDNHDVGLARGRSENNSQTILVVSRGR